MTETIKRLFGAKKQNEDFKFTEINKIVSMRSIRRDFPREVSMWISEMVKQGKIRECHCFTNAVLVANHLIEMGYSNVRVVDGTYRDLRHIGFGTDWHRFIQITLDNGVNRYYDATVEFLEGMGGTWRWEYKAIRVFELSEIERYNTVYYKDKKKFCKRSGYPMWENCMISTLHYSDWCKSYEGGEYGNFNPYLDNEGKYIGYDTLLPNAIFQKAVA